MEPTPISDEIANKIISKVNDLLNINQKITELTKPIKPLREDKKNILNDLTDLFIDNNITTYEVNGQVISLVDKIIKKKIDESTIAKGVEEKFEDINKSDNVENLTKLLLTSIYDCQDTESIQTLKITKKKKERKPRVKRDKQVKPKQTKKKQ